MRHLAEANRRAMQVVAQTHHHQPDLADLRYNRDQHRVSQQEDEENDEENIVIDMADEDDEDEDEDDVGPAAHQTDLVSASKFSNEDAANMNNNNNNNNNNNIIDGNESKHFSSYKQRDQLQVGDAVWFDPNQCGYCIPGKIVDFYPDVNVLTVEGYSQVTNPSVTEDRQQLADHNKLLVEADEQLQVYELSERQQIESDIKLRVPITDAQGLADLIELEELNNESIIWNLKLRYKQELVYTRCGQRILLSVNPFKSVNQLYNLDQVNKYDGVLTSNATRLRLQPLYGRALAQGANETNANLNKELERAKLIRWLVLHDVTTGSSKARSTCDLSAPLASLSPAQVGSLEPHLFELANQALEQLLVDGRDQCFILLGESGSGKTEVCKLLVQYLATINKSPSNLIQEQILESIQVLESFGSAKTALNDNSSRFGRLLEIQFDLSNGYIQSAQTCDLNLLDRSRIVCQIENERNYHVFYELLAGLSLKEKEKYGLQSGEKYFYLNQGHCVELPGKEDADDFRSLLSSMQVLGFNQDEQDTIFRLLASVLHLGNIYFHRKVLAVRSGKLAKQQQRLIGEQEVQQEQSVGVEGVEIGSDTEVRWVSHLLQIQFDSMMRCLTVRTTETHQASQPADRIVTPLNIDQALDTRDAIARTLYTCLFKWLLQRINSIIQVKVSDCDYLDDGCDTANPQQAIYLCRTSESLCEFQPDKLSTSMAGDSRQSSMSRGHGRSRSVTNRKLLGSACLAVLDAFGFENLTENNFEQLCINFTAEMLNYHTQRHLLRLEQAEYMRERLSWTQINTGTLQGANSHSTATNLYSASGSTLGASGAASGAAIVNLLSKKPLGILAILDDECNFPKATDQSFVEKCHHSHTLNENYQRARLSSNCHEFGIRHFRQPGKLVWYQVEGFIEKNRDSLRSDIMELLLSSKMTIVADMLRKLHPYETGMAGQQQQPRTLSRTYDGRLVTMKPRATSIAARFQDTLTNNRCLESLSCAPGLESNLERPIANPWFVLCLRPNRSKSPGIFDVLYVQDQVRSMRLLELAHIRRHGYPVKYRYADFLRRYRCLAVSRKFLESQQQAIYYSTKEKRRTIRDVCKSVIEFRLSFCHGNLLPQLQFSAEDNQAQLYQCGPTKVFLNERLHVELERQRLEECCKAISIIQRQMRMWPLRHRFLLERRAATVIQAHVRGYLAQRNYWRILRLIVKIQRLWRKNLLLKHQQALIVRREERRLLQHRQLLELQAKQKSNQLRHRVQQNTNQMQHRPQLDIPENLAQLYRAQRDQRPVHELSHLIEANLKELWELERRRVETQARHLGGNAPIIVSSSKMSDKEDRMSVDDDNKLDNLEAEEKFSLNNLILTYYSEESPSFGYSRLPITRPFSWPQICRRRRNALKRVPRAQDAQVVAYFAYLIQESIVIYKLLLRYIDSDLGPDDEVKTERVNKFKLIADYVIYLCQQKALLRDELFLQLLSLSWNNPRPKSKENVWRLMANCLSCFGPRDRSLISYMHQCAILDCPESYKKLILSKLRQIKNQPAGSVTQRVFPPCLLEYWANQKSVNKLGLTVSFYIDDYEHIRSSQHLHTLVELGSLNSAQQVAAASLEARGVPSRNLVGWSLELEHIESTPPPQSGRANACRLRGDDLVLDQISRLELFPEFINLLEKENSMDSYIQKVEPQANSQLRRNPSDLGPHTARARYSSDMDLARAGSRLSQTSRLNRRYLANQLGNRNDYANVSPQGFQHQHIRRAEQPEYQSDHKGYQNGFHESHQRAARLHRRSLSMQELQLASTSALNGRYFGQSQHQQMTSPRTDTSGSSHYASSYVHQYHRGSNPHRSSGGSLQQLVGNYYNQPPDNYQSVQCQPQRRRSQTPNSLQMQRFSSSAYGTGSSAYLVSDRSRAADHNAPLSPQDISQRRLSCRLSDDRLGPHASNSLSRDRNSTQHRRSSSSSVINMPVSSRSLASQPPDGSQAIARHQRRLKLQQAQTDASDTGSHYVASSIVSDTSDAVSLASHVRRIKVPPSNGDLDRYLDDLFQPMLAEADLDELSDARSLAPSIRAHGLQLTDQLGALNDPIALSKMIRGTTSPTPSETAPQICSDAEPTCRSTLSPTFETLLQSLKDSGSAQTTDETPRSLTAGLTQTSSLDQLGKMNFDELKALNEKLESQIQAAQINRPALSPIQFSSHPETATDIASNVQEELYSNRAKTIKIGKWRWPPTADESADLDTSVGEMIQQPANPPSPAVEEHLTVENASSQQSVATTSTNPGKLKISSEMKLKLEQLTTGSTTGQAPSTVPAVATVSSPGAVLQAKTLLDAGREQQHQLPVKKLSSNRRNLLENQLAGVSQERQSGSSVSPAGDESISGGKVMAAKQQLAAAAGVALAALDSTSQAGSRRQSSHIGVSTSGETPIEQNGELRRSRILQDELGPQSKSAISQRLAFYQQSNQDPLGQLDESRDANQFVEKETKPTPCQSREPAYGRSIAKSLAQRQQEALKDELHRPSEQWVSSSPDPTLTRPTPKIGQVRQPPSTKVPASTSKKNRAPPPPAKVEPESNEQLDICYLYGGVDWQVKIRKEFFLPSETYDDPLVVQLIFAQLVADVFNSRHWTRLSTKERATLKALMKDNSIGYVPSLPPIGQLQQVKRELVRMARTFGLYFTRPYAARNFVHCYPGETDLTGLEKAWIYGHSEDEGETTNLSASDGSSDESSQVNHEHVSACFGFGRAAHLAGRLQRADNLGKERIDLVAVHHSGLRLVCLLDDHHQSTLGGRGAGAVSASGHKVLETLKYRDMTDVSMVGPSELLVSMRNGRKCWILSSFEAKQLCSLLSYFHADYNNHLLASNNNPPSAGTILAGKRSGTFGAEDDATDIQHQSGFHPGKVATAAAKSKRLADNKDAILAPDDDHHGDHFKQRQTTDRLKQLNQTSDSHYDLADSQRVLPGYPSNSPKAPRTGARTGKQSAINHRPAPAAKPAPEQPASSTQSGVQLGKQAKSTSGQVEEKSSQQSAKQLARAAKAQDNKSTSKDQRTTENHQSISKTRNIWQNSLSRMSNKFSLFGGSQSRASDSARSNRPRQDQSSAQLHLDGWIETTTEFEIEQQISSSEAQQAHDSIVDSTLNQRQSRAASELDGSLQAADAEQSLAGEQQVVKQPEDGKHSLLQFALYNFREAIDKYSLESRAHKLAPQMDVGDTSTLRGSLKLIETLRGAGKQPTSGANQAQPSDGACASNKPGGRRGAPDWTWRELAEMVKFTQSPIKHSLLRLPSEDLNRRAVECFQAIMSYMGDLEHHFQSTGKSSHCPANMGEVECVYMILMNCHNYPILRDEIYCQLMKQTTNNRSTSNPDSCLRGWRLFSIVAAYFDCSDHFKPYLLKYLETAAYDKRRAYCSVALLCLQNLRKTFKYLGRKNVPSIEEIAATSAGRNSKRQIYRLPGGTERVINTKSTTVVEDIIYEICSNMLSIVDPDEMLEFSLYCIADGDLYTMPLNRDEYILDITTELIKNHQQYFLIFCRSIWHFPLRLESKLYIEVIFNQIAPDYLEGLLLILPGLSAGRRRHDGFQATAQPLRLKTKLVKEIARIAALLHRASGTDYMPHKDEIKYLLPKPIITAMKQQRNHANNLAGTDQTGSSSGSCSSAGSVTGGTATDCTTIKSGCNEKASPLDTVVTSAQKWIELVQGNWREMSAFDTLDAKAQFLDIIRNWPLFGSSFFAIKLIQRDLIHPTDYILALNKFGIQMLDTISHESVHKYPFNEVISTRKVRSEDGSLYLDLKCGNLMKRTIIRIQTDQAHEISRLTRQYIDIELLQQQKLQHQTGRQQQMQHPIGTRLSGEFSVAGSASDE